MLGKELALQRCKWKTIILARESPGLAGFYESILGTRMLLFVCPGPIRLLEGFSNVTNTGSLRPYSLVGKADG